MNRPGIKGKIDSPFYPLAASIERDTDGLFPYVVSPTGASYDPKTDQVDKKVGRVENKMDGDDVESLSDKDGGKCSPVARTADQSCIIPIKG